MASFKMLSVDRLQSLQRIKDCGEIVHRGAEDIGACKVKIVEAQFAPSEPTMKLILAHCNQQLVLCAKVENWPVSVDVTGKKIHIWLNDYSFVRSLAKPFLFREFIFTFFNDFAATNFFSTYTSCLVSEGQQNTTGLSYEEMLNLLMAMGEMKSRKRKRDEDDDSSILDDSADDIESDCDSILGDGNGKDKEEDNEEDAEKAGLFLIDDYGASQDVYEELRVVRLPFSRNTKRAKMMALSDEL